MDNISMTAFRLEHEKLASKKTLIKKLKSLSSKAGDKLYGKKKIKPHAVDNFFSSLIGGAGGAAAGGLGGVAAGAHSAPGFNALGNMFFGGTAGALLGALGGAKAGKTGYKKLINARHAKKRALRKKLTNLALGGGGLAALLAGTSKSKKGKK